MQPPTGSHGQSAMMLMEPWHNGGNWMLFLIWKIKILKILNHKWFWSGHEAALYGIRPLVHQGHYCPLPLETSLPSPWWRSFTSPATYPFTWSFLGLNLGSSAYRADVLPMNHGAHYPMWSNSPPNTLLCLCTLYFRQSFYHQQPLHWGSGSIPTTAPPLLWAPVLKSNILMGEHQFLTAMLPKLATSLLRINVPYL